MIPGTYDFSARFGPPSFILTEDCFPKQIKKTFVVEEVEDDGNGKRRKVQRTVTRTDEEVNELRVEQIRMVQHHHLLHHLGQ